jgi:hypothetical protein
MVRTCLDTNQMLHYCNKVMDDGREASFLEWGYY